jgi:putative endonuclease
MNGVEKGRRGEDFAAAFLFERGYRILNRNWRLKSGEIDIIAEKSGVLVFCEVKSRSSLRYGSGAEAVNFRKQQQIIRTAMLYLQKYRLNECACRFDVIEILDNLPEFPQIHHIINAFGR